MLVKTKAIVISSLKYQEKSLIVKCFTLSDGLKSYFVREVFSSRKSNQKAAYFVPLTIIEIEANHKKNGTLEQIKEIQIATPLYSIHTHIVKSAIVIFLSEVLHHAIREEEKNEPLFTFMETALLWLDHNDDIANFHLIFLLETTKYLGFYPDISNLDYPFFELSEGVFSPFHAITSLTDQETYLFKKLIGLKFNAEIKTGSVKERQILLKILMDYYAFHLSGFQKPKSIEVLKSIFSS